MILGMLLFLSAIGIPISDRIDHALVFIDAGRLDLAEIQLKKLLGEELTPLERVTILYNLATLQMRDNHFEEALRLLDQIEASFSINSIQKESPTLAANIAYNRAISLVMTLSKEPNAKNAEAAKSAVAYVAAIFPHVTPLEDGKPISPLILTYLYEQIAAIESENEMLTFLAELQAKNKQELLDAFVGMLQEAIHPLSELVGYDDLSLYLENFLDAYRFKIFSYIERIALFLNAPAKVDAARMRDFLLQKLLVSANALERDVELDAMLSSLYQMRQIVVVIEAEAVDNDVAALLQGLKSSARAAHQLFWEGFVNEYLRLKIEVTQDPFEKALLEKVLKRQELEFWNVVKTPLKTTYPQLFASDSPILFDGAIERLSAFRTVVDAPKYKIAEERLQEAKASKNRKFLVIESWFEIYPQEAIAFFVAWVEKNHSKENLDMLIRLLDRDPDVKEVTSYLKTVVDPNHFEVGLTLSWLTTWVQKETSAREGILARVEAAIVFQDTVQLKGETSWLMSLQKKASEKLKMLTEKSELDPKKKKELLSLFTDVAELASSKNQSQAIIQRLQRALEILQEMTPEEEPKEDLTSKSDLTMQMQKKTLKLSPETSIRLLQEMERDDANLFQKPKVEQVGAKPW